MKKRFHSLFPDTPDDDVRHVYSPYRVCPVGAHIDHQYGHVTGFALDHGVDLMYTPTVSGIINLFSMNFEGQILFTLESVPHKSENWGALCTGCDLRFIENPQTRVRYSRAHFRFASGGLGCPEMIYLFGLMRETPGIYGGRFSRAGFKGCCMVLSDPARRDEIIQNVSTKYLAKFPEIDGRYSAHVCHTADGARRIN
jgi:galactokinase